MLQNCTQLTGSLFHPRRHLYRGWRSFSFPGLTQTHLTPSFSPLGSFKESPEWEAAEQGAGTGASPAQHWPPGATLRLWLRHYTTCPTLIHSTLELRPQLVMLHFESLFLYFLDCIDWYLIWCFIARNMHIILHSGNLTFKFLIIHELPTISAERISFGMFLCTRHHSRKFCAGDRGAGIFPW